MVAPKKIVSVRKIIVKKFQLRGPRDASEKYLNKRNRKKIISQNIDIGGPVNEKGHGGNCCASSKMNLI